MIVDASLVSIVVTTRNEERNIEACLESIRLQSYSSIEVIVVDNSSTDRTKEIASSYTKHVYDWGPERSAQRNFGLLRISTGQILAYIDADMVLAPDVVLRAVELISTGVIGVYVPEVVLGSKYVSRLRRFERSFYDATPVDAVRFFRSDAFRRVGGFDEDLFRSGSGEDWDLDLSLMSQGKFGSIPQIKDPALTTSWAMVDWCRQRGVEPTDASVIFHNEADIRLLDYLRKKAYYATGFAGYIEKWGVSNPYVRKQFGLGYRLFGVFFEKGKWVRVARRPDLYFGVLFLRALVGFSYLRVKFRRLVGR